MKNKFNKDFEDLGWAEMQKLLDRDLPVAERKRRRGLVFWSSLIVGLLAITGTFMYAGFKNNQSELNIPIKNSELKPNNTELNTPINNNQLVINNSELNKPIDNNKLVINNSLQTSNNKQQTENTPPQYLSEKQVIITEYIPQGKVIPVEQVFALNTNKLKEIQANSLINSDLKGINWTAKPKIIEPAFKPKSHFGVTTGIHTEGEKGLNGWQLGVIFNREFDKNWSYSAGLNFRKTTVNSNSLVYYKVELSNSTTPYSNSPSRASKLILNGLNYLELPLNLNYHLNKKWAISAGIKTSYLLSANVNVSSDSTLFIIQTGNNGTLSKDGRFVTLDNADPSNAKSLGLKRLDVATMAGIQFNPTKRFQLSLRYDYGFGNILNRTNWSAYNRFIGFNAAYYF
jgi:Outer membrane protein beta-barrel domain